MNALRFPFSLRRGGLFLFVLGAHALLGVGLWTVKTVAPQLLEQPLIVDLLTPAPEIKPPEAKPLPVAKPLPMRSAPRPRTPAPPVIETTQSAAPAPAAISAPAEPPKPAPPAPEPVSAARFDADYLKNPAPAYPPLARRMGEEGKVILRVAVSAQGLAERVEVRTSSGSPRLDEAALRTVQTWRFIPARRGSEAVASSVLVPIIFKLEQ